MESKSSLHEPNGLGWTRVTRKRTKSVNWATKRKSLKSFLIGLQAESRLHQTGIKSNRKSESFGECILSQVIYRPSKAGRLQRVKSCI